jgi:hypothetical protein
MTQPGLSFHITLALLENQLERVRMLMQMLTQDDKVPNMKIKTIKFSDESTEVILMT